MQKYLILYFILCEVLLIFAAYFFILFYLIFLLSKYELRFLVLENKKYSQLPLFLSAALFFYV